MGSNNLKRLICTSLLYGLFVFSSCTKTDEAITKDVDFNEAFNQQWKGTLEKELIEPSGSWIIFSPETNMVSVLRLFHGDTTVIDKVA